MRVEVLNHQMTIDYLNESFQTEANVDLTSIDYMEKIKQINIDWIRIKSLISARIDVNRCCCCFSINFVFHLDVGTIERSIQRI